LDFPPKGSTNPQRIHLLQVYKTTGKVPEGLNLPAFPVELDYFLDWSRELIGSEPVKYTEIYHWSLLKNIKLNPWEVDVLSEIDSIFHRVKHERSDR